MRNRLSPGAAAHRGHSRRTRTRAPGRGRRNSYTAKCMQSNEPFRISTEIKAGRRISRRRFYPEEVPERCSDCREASWGENGEGIRRRVAVSHLS